MSETINLITPGKSIAPLNVSSFPSKNDASSAAIYHRSKKIFEIQLIDESNWEAVLDSPLYKIIWLTSGSGSFISQSESIRMNSGDLLFLTPRFFAKPLQENPPQGWLIHFHSDFYCLEKHQQEVGCNGILFNDSYRIAPVHVESQHRDIFHRLMADLFREAFDESPAKQEAMVAYLKLFLVHASRIKLLQQAHPLLRSTQNDLPEKLILFQELLEANFHREKSPRFYADELNVSSFTLNRLTQSHFKRSATNFIYDRIILEAKRELYLTEKNVNEISFSLGFDDEFYFSRIFKKRVGLSPSQFRASHSSVNS